MKNLLYSFLWAICALIVFTGCKDEEVTPATSLELTVTDNLGNVVSGATVKLYSSETNWFEKKNQVGPTYTTDASGKVTIKDLEAISYYWFIEKNCKNNQNGSATTTSPLAANKNTTVTTVLSDTGTIVLTNNSTNPYQIFINGTLAFTANGNESYSYNYAPAGTYSIRVLQVSGYAVFPTDKTYNGSLTCGGTLTTTFPN